MHRLLACLALGGLYALAAAEPLPAVDHASTKPPCTESSEPSYPVSTLSPVGISTGVTADPIGVSSSSIIANVSVYTATEISSSSIESLSVYSNVSIDPAITGTGSSSVPTLVSTSGNISSTTEGNALPTYTWSVPSVTTPTSTGSIVTGDPSGSTAAPVGTGVSSGSLLSPYNTVSDPIYTNTSTTESASIYVFETLFPISDGISGSPTSTSELTTTLTIKATRSLTSTISSVNGSIVDPTIATQSANSTYSTGISIGTGTLGGVTANSTSTIGLYPPFHGPFTPSSYPISSPSSAPGTATGSGTSPASGVASLYPPIITGVSGTGTLSPVTASIYSSNLTSTSVNATSLSDPASTASVPTYSHSFGTAITSSSNQSATVLLPYPISSNSTTTAGPMAISSGIVGSATGLPPTYTLSGTTISDPNITTSSTDESPTAIAPYPTPSNGTTNAGLTASSFIYPTASESGTTDLSGTEPSSAPIDTTCTETLTTTLADGSTALLPTTFVTTTSPPVYPTASFNSTAVDDPITGSSSFVGTVSILTTGPVETISGSPVYSPLVPYPIVTPSVPAEYYYHHRRPHNDRYKGFPTEEEEDESPEGYTYDDGEEYDYGDDEDYEYK